MAPISLRENAGFTMACKALNELVGSHFHEHILGHVLLYAFCSAAWLSLVPPDLCAPLCVGALAHTLPRLWVILFPDTVHLIHPTLWRFLHCLQTHSAVQAQAE